MAKIVNKLKPYSINKLVTKGYYSDGNGLYLQVSCTGSKSWIFRFTRNGKTHEMGLGSFTAFSLAEARARTIEQRKLLADGINPLENKRDSNARLVLNNRITFAELAEQYINTNKSGWRNPKHVDQWRNTLATYANPVIGSMNVSNITISEVRDILDPIWNTKNETATRVRGRIEKVLDYAKVSGYRTGDNPAAWKGNLSLVLPSPSAVAKVTHQPALPYKDLPAFMVALSSHKGDGASALALIILTATRTSEVICADWSEFDLPNSLWTIPAERMKAKKEHVIPLSPQAMSILSSMHTANATGYLFKGKNGKPASNGLCLSLLKRMDSDHITVHGFRSTFRDWASETTTHPADVVEMALAHTIQNKVEAAYRRGDLLDKRRVLMNEWADYASPVSSD